ncbi:MAG: relaxase/mobilization nuclease domain-containing protein, partial [Gammaproteobacteria bacterium]|nr:relaxase/mobilization nuclease domain-containing protein [Gammaproteobacteria bacterium]
MIAKQHSARSFAAVSDYLLHDKQARTDKRVAWMEADNIWSDNPRRAARQMARTFDEATRLKSEAGLAATGRRVVSPVFHFSLSWAQDEVPTRAHMAEQARDVLKKLGLGEHQALIVCHDDEPHPHVHILVSRIHPETGRANNLPHSKRKLQDWALAYERAQGKIRCKLREENAKKLERGEKPRYDDPVIR